MSQASRIFPLSMFKIYTLTLYRLLSIIIVSSLVIITGMVPQDGMIVHNTSMNFNGISCEIFVMGEL